MNKDLAKTLADLILDVSGRLDQSLQLAKRGCDHDEYVRYRDVVATVLTEFLIGVLNPIYRSYPELKPSEFGPVPSEHPSCAIHGPRVKREEDPEEHDD